MSVSADAFEGGVQVGNRTSGSRGTPALTAPQSLAGAEDYRLRHKLKNGQRVTVHDLAITREDGETIMPDATVIAQVQQINRARHAPPVPDEESAEEWAYEEEPEAIPLPKIRRRRTAVIRAQPIDCYPEERPHAGFISEVPTVAALEALEARIIARIAAGEKRLLKRVQQLIDEAWEEIAE